MVLNAADAVIGRRPAGRLLSDRRGRGGGGHGHRCQHSAQHLARIFGPFFSTKDKARDSVSVVYGMWSDTAAGRGEEQVGQAPTCAYACRSRAPGSGQRRGMWAGLLQRSACSGSRAGAGTPASSGPLRPPHGGVRTAPATARRAARRLLRPRRGQHSSVILHWLAARPPESPSCWRSPTWTSSSPSSPSSGGPARRRGGPGLDRPLAGRPRPSRSECSRAACKEATHGWATPSGWCTAAAQAAS